MTAAQRPPSATAPGVGPFVLWGAVGFGIGGVLCGLIQDALHPAVMQSPVLESLAATLGFAVMGILGGAALGLAARDRRLLRRLVLTGVLGFGVGGLLNLVLVFTSKLDLSAVPPFAPGGIPGGASVHGYVALMYFLAFGIRGAIGGAVLGLAVPNRHSVRVLSVAGAAGFGLGGVAGFAMLNLPGWNPLVLGEPGIYLLWMASSTVIGGAALGWALAVLARTWSQS